MGIVDIYSEIKKTQDKLSQETFSIEWLGQTGSYMRTIKSQGREPSVGVYVYLMASVDKKINTSSNEIMTKIFNEIRNQTHDDICHRMSGYKLLSEMLGNMEDE